MFGVLFVAMDASKHAGTYLVASDEEMEASKLNPGEREYADALSAVKTYIFDVVTVDMCMSACHCAEGNIEHTKCDY